MLNDVMCPTCQPGRPGRYPNAPFPSIDRPRGVLTLEAFAFAQRRGAGATLQTMAYECWRAYRNALTLTRPGLPLPDAFARRPNNNLGPLLLPWDRVCVWYREHMFDRQLDLFTCPHDTELTRWHRWVDTCCTAVILDQPLWVRTFLETLGYLPKPTHADDCDAMGRVTVSACFDTIINANTEALHER